MIYEWDDFVQTHPVVVLEGRKILSIKEVNIRQAAGSRGRAAFVASRG